MCTVTFIANHVSSRWSTREARPRVIFVPLLSLRPLYERWGPVSEVHCYGTHDGLGLEGETRAQLEAVEAPRYPRASVPAGFEAAMESCDHTARTYAAPSFSKCDEVGSSEY